MFRLTLLKGSFTLLSFCNLSVWALEDNSAEPFRLVILLTSDEKLTLLVLSLCNYLLVSAAGMLPFLALFKFYAELPLEIPLNRLLLVIELFLRV